MSATAGEATIVVEAVQHTYKGGVQALKGVDLTIGRGLFGLLGPNGAGKSTLMRILCTLLVPSQGTARVGGYDVVTDRDKVRGMLGYLPQDFGAWRLQRVNEALDTLALLSGLTDKAERRRRVEESLEQVGLSAVARRKVKKLSGGMLRRLGVAQALVHQPRIVVVDEPTVGLDPEERLRFRQLMADLGQERTIVLSTHIVADLGSSCRDLALLDAGRVVFRGSPQELLRQATDYVFEVRASADAAADLGPGIEVVSQVPEGAGLRVRAVGPPDRRPAGAVSVEKPTLEEGYLAFMAARGQSGAAAAAQGPSAVEGA